MELIIDISRDRYDEIMSMDWKNCRLIFDEEIRAIHDGKALDQEPCENCCNGNQIEKAKLCQKSYLAGMEHKQEPCGDAVSRQAVLDTIGNVPDYDDGMVFEALSHAQRDVALLSPVTAHQKMGKWIIKDGKEQGYDIAGIKTWYIQIMCDKCGFIKTAIEWHTGQYKFCPNCGAKMQEVEE